MVPDNTNVLIKDKFNIRRINVVSYGHAVLHFYPVFELISLEWTRNLYRV